MANQSVLELAVNTGKWDAGLKKATQALNNFTEAGGGLAKTLQDESGKMQQFVSMMGGLESKAKTAKGQMNDYKSAIEQLTMQYNRMSQAQQQSIGQSYLQAIDQLKQKYQGVNAEIEEMNRALKNTPQIQLPTGGGFLSGIGDKMGGALQVFGGNLMTQAAGWAMQQVGEMQELVKQSIEVARAAEGIKNAYDRLNQPNLLKNLKEATHGTVSELELMKAAVKFNDFNLPLEELGTMLAFAQQKAKDTGQSVDFLVDSIVNGLGRKSLMILDNLGLSATEIRDKMKDTGDMTKAVGEIIREKMAQAGDYVETAADRAAKANADLEDAMLRLGETFKPLTDSASSMWNNIKIGALDLLNNVIKPLIDSMTEAGRLRREIERINNPKSEGGKTHSQDVLDRLREYSGDKQGLYNRQLTQYDTTENTAWRNYNRLKEQRENFRQEAMNRGARESDIDTFNDFDRQIEKAKNQALAIQKLRVDYIAGAKDILNPATPTTPTTPTNPVTPTGIPRTTTKVKGGTEPYTGPIQLEVPEGTTESMKQLSEQLRYFNELRQNATTTGDYLAATEGIEHTKLQMGVQGDALAMGVSTDAMLAIQEGLKESMAESFASAFEGFQINPEDVEGMKEGNPMEEMKKGMEKLSTVMSGLSSITSGLSAVGIKLDGEFGQFLKGIQGVISIVQGVMTIIAASSVPSEAANTISTNANTIALGVLTDTVAANSIIHAIPGLANGGVIGRAALGFTIPGNSMSGDNLRLPVVGGGMIAVNSGETILNRAQAGNLLAQLESSDRNQEGGAQPYVDGELIFLGINNYLRRSGMGELVTSNI